MESRYRIGEEGHHAEIKGHYYQHPAQPVSVLVWSAVRRERMTQRETFAVVAELAKCSMSRSCESWGISQKSITCSSWPMKSYV
jgi:hypothetical protein